MRERTGVFLSSSPTLQWSSDYIEWGEKKSNAFVLGMIETYIAPDKDDFRKLYDRCFGGREDEENLDCMKILLTLTRARTESTSPSRRAHSSSYTS
jgi:hypothetical protein